MPSVKDILDPCAWVWLALILAAFWNWRKKNSRLSVAAGLLALVLTLSESFALPQRLLVAKEAGCRRAADAADFTQSLASAQAVVMCGGMLEISPHDFSGVNYSEAVDRFFQAVALARRLRLPLALGGGRAGGKESPAGTLLESTFEKTALQDWGLTNLTVLELGPCLTTRDEALAALRLAKQNGWHKIVLVTSAYHMERAAGAFAAAGLWVVPAGCDYWNANLRFTLRLLPTTSSAEALRLWLCEEAGAIYYRSQGWL